MDVAEQKRRHAIEGFYEYTTGRCIEPDDIYLIKQDSETWIYAVITETSTKDRIDIFTVTYYGHRKQFIYDLDITSLEALRKNETSAEALAVLYRIELRLQLDPFIVDTRAECMEDM